MISRQVTSSWHSAPSAWIDYSTSIGSTGASTTARTAAGSPAGSTARASTIQRSSRESVSTESSAGTTSSTSQSSGGVSTSGSSGSHGATTNADTSSSRSDKVGTTTVTASASFTRSIPRTTSTSFTEGLGVFQSSTSGSTGNAIVAWPSTFNTTLTSGTDPDTTTYTAQTCGSSVTLSRTSSFTYVPTPTSGNEYASSESAYSTLYSTDSDGTTFLSTSDLSHNFLPLCDTKAIADAGGGVGQIGNRAVIWWPGSAVTTTDTTALFSQIFTTLGSGTNEATAAHYTRIGKTSRVWLTHSLSTETFTSTSTTRGTGADSTNTGSENYTSDRSSLNGSPWDTTGTGESTQIWIGPITGESTTTAEIGTETISGVLLTYTRQITGLDTDSSFTTSVSTESFQNIYSLSITWETWHRSYTTTSEFDYPVSTTTKFLYQLYSSGGWLCGSASSTSQEWQTITRTTSWTEYDELTNALLIGVFSSTAQTTATGSNTTAATTVETLTGVYNRTDWSESQMHPFVTPQSDHELTRYARFWQQMYPKGFFGFGGGFTGTDQIYVGLSSSVFSGTADPSWSLVASQMPRAVLMPDASILITGRCWLSGHTGSSTISATWLGSETGPRTSASLKHVWLSTMSTSTTVTSTTGTFSTTAGSLVSATIVVGMTGSIPGSFYSEYEPWLNTFQSGIGRPVGPGLVIGSGGGPAAGIAPSSTAAQTATFPAGAITWTVGTGTDTTSQSTSTSTGEFTLEFSASSGAIAFSYEEALAMRWSVGDFAQFETASRYYLPAWPWFSDLQ